MSTEIVRSILAQTKALQKDAINLGLNLPDEEGVAARSEMVLRKALTNGTRGYIEKVANQVNSTFR